MAASVPAVPQHAGLTRETFPGPEKVEGGRKRDLWLGRGERGGRKARGRPAGQLALVHADTVVSLENAALAKDCAPRASIPTVPHGGRISAGLSHATLTAPRVWPLSNTKV